MYDGDGRRVKSIFNNNATTTYFVGTHYEVTNPGANQTITKYYYAGSQRIAMRTNGTLNFLLGDHLGSTSLTTDATGHNTIETRYKAWGEERYASGATPTKYTYTGQYSNMSDFGLMFYNARWYDPALGRFAQADTIIPGGVQGLDRYAYVGNSPVRYTDPTGHCILCLTAAIAGGVLLGATIYNNFIHEPSAPADGNASNVSELMQLGYEHADHANITGEGLQSLQDDPSLQAAQERLVNIITGKPEYGEQSYSLKDISSSFAANGPSGKWYQAALERNQAFYMVHVGTLSATNTNVSADGTISTTWHIHDDFDFIPGPDRSKEYNYWATIVHYFYNDLLGGEESYPTDAYWNETIPPQEKKSTPK